MLARGSGAVLNVSSDAAVAAYPGWGAYGASKAALDHLAAIWDAEVSSQGVRVLAVDPGEMDTQMHAAAMPDADPGELARPEWVADWIAESLPSWLENAASRHEAPARDELASRFGAQLGLAAGGAR